MGNWQVEPAVPAVASPAPALGSLFAREYAAPQTRLHPSRVSDAGAAWRSYEAEVMAEPAARAERVADEADEALHYPLGVARGQVSGTYIVAEADDGDRKSTRLNSSH